MEQNLANSTVLEKPEFERQDSNVTTNSLLIIKEAPFLDKFSYFVSNKVKEAREQKYCSTKNSIVNRVIDLKK